MKRIFKVSYEMKYEVKLNLPDNYWAQITFWAYKTYLSNISIKNCDIFIKNRDNVQ